jgi:hypothetical protein
MAKEDYPLSDAAEYEWVRFPAGKILAHYLASLNKYPPIAADPCTPPK